MANKSNLAFSTTSDNPVLNTVFSTGIGVIGAGYWGPKMARKFNQQSELRVVAVCDANPDKMRPFRALDPEIGCYGDFRDLISNPKVNAVAISTGDAGLYEVAKAALDNGLHVLVESCEKASEEETTALKENAEARGLELSMVAFPNGGMLGGTLPEDVQAEMTNFLENIQKE
jgi:predicted dehydrogenase